MDLTENLPEVLTQWKVAPQMSQGELSFALEAGSDQEASLWQLDLPSDPQAAAEQLQQAEVQVMATQNALADVTARIDAMVDNIQTQGQQQVSFGESQAITIAPAEIELVRWLDTIDPVQVSFGLEAVPTSQIQAASQQFRQVTENLLHLLVNFAWVETQLQGSLLARTVVNWTGDMQTAWRPEVLPGELALHFRSLKLALASRITLLRLFIIVTQSATKISVLIATPGGAVLALPAAWKFVNNVLAEVNKYQELTQTE
jgi:hypothetical protein